MDTGHKTGDPGSHDSLEIRPATLDDYDEIEALIKLSSRSLASQDYTTEQIEIALQAVLGVDTQLIRDGTYFVAESAGRIIGCGGWSRRRTLFGGDAVQGRDDQALDPKVDAAKIRAIYVHPEHARQGLGTQILKHCENAAQRHGFIRLELGATLPGQRLFQSHGYLAGQPYEYECLPGKFMTVVPMKKDLDVGFMD